MDSHAAMRNFHSCLRSQIMEDIKDPEMIEKLWGLNYLSSVRLDSGQILIPSNFLLPKLEPRNLDELDSKDSDASSSSCEQKDSLV